MSKRDVTAEPIRHLALRATFFRSVKKEANFMEAASNEYTG